jgi:hypothetical protein
MGSKRFFTTEAVKHARILTCIIVTGIKNIGLEVKGHPITGHEGPKGK